MMLKDAILARIQSDAQIMALLPGGVKVAEVIGRDGESASDAPYDATGVIMLTHMKIRRRAFNGVQPQVIGAEAGAVEFYVYQDTGYDEIEMVLNRLAVILHDTYLEADDRVLVHLLLTYTSPELFAREYNAPTSFARYTVYGARAL